MRDLAGKAKASRDGALADARRVTNRHPLVQRLVTITFGVIEKQSEYRLSLNAAGAAFWLVIAVFPATIAMITMFGLVVDPETIADDVVDITKRSPNSLGAALASQAQQAAAAEASSLSIGFVTSLVVTLWSVSSGAYAMFRAIRQAYDLPPQSYVVARARAFAAAVAGVILLGLAVGGGALLFARLDRADTTVRVLALSVAGLLAVVVFAAAVTWAFRYSIAAATPWRSLLPGAVLGTVVTVALVIGVALFGSYMANYQAIYGTLTGIIVALIAGYTVMYVLLLAAVFNQQWAPLPGQTNQVTVPDGL